MDMWDRVAVRAYWRAAFALALACGLAVIVGNLSASPIFAGVVDLARWAPALALLAALVLFATPTYRLLRWERWGGPACPRCGGPLGHERTGYASRGGAYRQCYACGNNANHRHYE